MEYGRSKKIQKKETRKAKKNDVKEANSSVLQCQLFDVMKVQKI